MEKVGGSSSLLHCISVGAAQSLCVSQKLLWISLKLICTEMCTHCNTSKIKIACWLVWLQSEPPRCPAAWLILIGQSDFNEPSPFQQTIQNISFWCSAAVPLVVEIAPRRRRINSQHAYVNVSEFLSVFCRYVIFVCVIAWEVQLVSGPEEMVSVRSTGCIKEEWGLVSRELSLSFTDSGRHLKFSICTYFSLSLHPC